MKNENRLIIPLLLAILNGCSDGSTSSSRNNPSNEERLPYESSAVQLSNQEHSMILALNGISADQLIAGVLELKRKRPAADTEAILRELDSRFKVRCEAICHITERKD